MGLPTVLFVIFLVLKLVHAVAWSWWWVTAPLWIDGGLTVLALLFTGAGVLAVKKTIDRARF